MVISIIAAVAKNNVIGNNNKLPWHLPADLKHFKVITLGHTIVMGQNTYESIGKPLPGRLNIVLSFDPNYKAPGALVVNNLENAIKKAKETGEEELFIIGGASVFKQTIDLADKLYITYINKIFKGDTFFPEINKQDWKLEKKETFNNPFSYEFKEYLRVV